MDNTEIVSASLKLADINLVTHDENNYTVNSYGWHRNLFRSCPHNHHLMRG